MTDSTSPFSWNAGGWFGSQLGGTCWMLVAGILAFRLDAEVGVIVLVLFAAANIAGLILWSRRLSLSAYIALQIMLVIAGATSIAATYVLDSAGLFEAIQSGGSVSATFMYLAIIGVVLSLLVSFGYRQRGH